MYIYSIDLYNFASSNHQIVIGRYGLETLSQLISYDGYMIHSNLTIVDEPKFVHRGLMLDTG